ncbi:hypothetical protein [Endozoicomonas lisbonensis]|uniref:Uncharacterized protein n=1 Tax=Endozoicomonas lisbonensis TaxID=3120522 RepID=A0ABV2SDM7_9GAMM
MSSIDSSGAARSAQILKQATQSAPAATGKSFGKSVSLPPKAASMPTAKSPPSLPTSPDHSQLLASRRTSCHTPVQSYIPRPASNSGVITPDSNDLPPPPSESELRQLSGNTDAQPGDRTDTRNKKQKVADAIRSKGRKLKSAVFSEAKRWVTGKNWKKVPPDVLKTFPEDLQAKVEARNEKLERLDGLKTMKQEWQQFERQFGKELDLLDSDKSPKSGKFKIPDTGKEFVFSKSQSRDQKKEMLREFKEAFSESAGYNHYKKASEQTADIDSLRTSLKDELSLSTKELSAALDQHYEQVENQKHSGIDKATETRHKALGQEKGRVEEGYDKLLVHYQDKVSEAERNLSDLRTTRDKFRSVEIPKKRRGIKQLEAQLKRQKSRLETQYKQLPEAERKTTSKKEFLQSGLGELVGKLNKAKSEKAEMDKRVDFYPLDRKKLTKKLEQARSDLKKVTDSDAFSATLENLDKRTHNEDKVAEKEHKQVTETLRKERNNIKKINTWPLKKRFILSAFLTGV